jgi:hypothetical protein
LRLWSWIVLLLPWTLSAEGWLLVNESVPAGEQLAKGYQEMYPDEPMKVIRLDLDPMESMKEKDLVQLKEVLLGVKGEGSWPEWSLSFYGMPLKIETASGTVGFEAWLACLPGPDYQVGKLVFNPDFYREGPRWKPIRACRLDGPALRHAQGMLVSWSRAAQWGSFRRSFPMSDEGVTASLLRSAGHLVQPRGEAFLVRENEIQFWECRDDELLQLEEHVEGGKLPPGAMIFRYHNKAEKEGRFRSSGGSSAGVAVKWGASFFVGAMAPMKVEADLCDAQLFLTRYLRGESFASSIYAATPNLGGSLLILGDPLAKPYDREMEKVYEASFMGSHDHGDDPVTLKAMAEAKDWWLLREYLQLWEKARFEVVIATLKVAIQQRTSSIFHELLMRCRFQFGGVKEAEAVWGAWPKEGKGDWEVSFRKILLSED